MESNSWYPLINGKSYKIVGKIDEVLSQLRALSQEHEADLASIEKNYGGLEAQKENLVRLSAQAGQSSAMAGLSQKIGSYTKSFFKFIKSFWKSFKALGRFGKKLRLYLLMGLLCLIFFFLFNRETAALRELLLPYIICFGALLLALYLITLMNSSETDKFELLRAIEIASVSASIPMIVQRINTLVEVLEVLQEDLKDGGVVKTKVYYQPSIGGAHAKLESRFSLEMLMSDDNELELECGFTAKRDQRPKGEKLKPCLIFNEALEVMVKVKGEQYKAGVKSRTAKAIGPFRKIEMKGPQLVGSGKERLVGTTFRAVDKLVRLPDLQAKPEHLLQALSFLYGSLRAKKPTKPVKPTKPSVAVVPAAPVAAPAKQTAPPKEPKKPRTLAELVDLVLADGVLTTAEKQFVEKVIAHDGKYTSEEKKQIARIQKLVREGKVRYEK